MEMDWEPTVTVYMIPPRQRRQNPDFFLSPRASDAMPMPGSFDTPYQVRKRNATVAGLPERADHVPAAAEEHQPSQFKRVLTAVIWWVCMAGEFSRRQYDAVRRRTARAAPTAPQTVQHIVRDHRRAAPRPRRTVSRVRTSASARPNIQQTPTSARAMTEAGSPAATANPPATVLRPAIVRSAVVKPAVTEPVVAEPAEPAIPVYKLPGSLDEMIAMVKLYGRVGAMQPFQPSVPIVEHPEFPNAIQPTRFRPPAPSVMSVPSSPIAEHPEVVNTVQTTHYFMRPPPPVPSSPTIEHIKSVKQARFRRSPQPSVMSVPSSPFIEDPFIEDPESMDNAQQAAPAISRDEVTQSASSPPSPVSLPSSPFIEDPESMDDVQQAAPAISRDEVTQSASSPSSPVSLPSSPFIEDPESMDDGQQTIPAVARHEMTQSSSPSQKSFQSGPAKRVSEFRRTSRLRRGSPFRRTTIPDTYELPVLKESYLSIMLRSRSERWQSQRFPEVSPAAPLNHLLATPALSKELELFPKLGTPPVIFSPPRFPLPAGPAVEEMAGPSEETVAGPSAGVVAGSPEETLAGRAEDFESLLSGLVIEEPAEEAEPLLEGLPKTTLERSHEYQVIKDRAEEAKRAEAERAEAAKRAEEAALERARQAQEKVEEMARRARGGRRMPSTNFIQPLSEEWEKKIEQAMSKGDHATLTTLSDGTPLRKKDFATVLGSRAWLNDEAINGYLEWITEHANEKAGRNTRPTIPKVVCQSSFFYKKISTEGPRSVARWMKRKRAAGKSLLEVDTLLIPVNSSSHWTLIVVSPKTRALEYLDSFGGPNDEFIQNTKAWLAVELGDAWREDDWRVLPTQSACQYNGWDCGVFAITNAECVAGGISTTSYDASHMAAQRRRIAAVLLNRGFGGDLIAGADL